MHETKAYHNSRRKKMLALLFALLLYLRQTRHHVSVIFRNAADAC